MGAIFSRDDLETELVANLMEETGFTRTQIHRLYIRYQHLDKNKKGYLDEDDLHRIQRVSWGKKILRRKQIHNV